MTFGPPGSGKSTFLNYFDEQNTISTGNILRSMGLAKQDGTLVEDSKVNKILLDSLKQRLSSGFIILDGYPRRKEQAEFLYYLEEKGIIKPKMFIELDCSDENVLDRTCNRLSCDCGETYHPTLKPSRKENECDKCHHELHKRADDEPHIIQHRLKLYHAQKDAVKGCFSQIVNVIDVNENLKQGLKNLFVLIQQNVSFPITCNSDPIIHSDHRISKGNITTYKDNCKTHD